MPRDILELTLERSSSKEQWGFRIVGGTDEALLLKVDKVHGIGTPAGRAGLEANDAIITIDGQDVSEMTHSDVVRLVRNSTGLNMTIGFERGDRVIPSISEAFPIKEAEVNGMTKEEKMEYYRQAMKKGLERFLIPDNFTSVGKPKIKTPKYNCPLGLYSDDTMDDMITGSTHGHVDETKLDPDGVAMSKLKKSKRFDPSRSGVLDVISAQAKGDYSVDRKAIIQARINANED